MLHNYELIYNRVVYELRGLPDVDKVRIHVRQVINEVHTELCMSYPWPFLRETRQFVWLPDIEILQQASPYTSVLAIESDPAPKSSSTDRMFSISGLGNTIVNEYDDWTAAEAYGAGEVLDALFGATLDVVDHSVLDDATSVGNWAIAPFEIQRAWMDEHNPNDPLSLVNNLSLVYIVCDDRCLIDSMDLSEGHPIIRFPRRRLTADIMEVRGLRIRRTGQKPRPLTAVDATTGLGLEENRAGEPQLWWMDEGLRTRFGGAGINATALPLLSAIRTTDGILGRRTPAPYNGMKTPTSTTPGGFTCTAGNGGLSAATKLAPGKYLIRLAWMVAGRLSPPSEPVEVTVSGSNDQIVIADIPVRDLYWHGWTMTVWASYKPTGMAEYGPFYLAQGSEPEDNNEAHPAGNRTLTTLTLTRDYFDWGNPSAMIRWDDVWAGPDHRYIAIWPRPSKPTLMEMDVTRRPRQLLEPTDATHLPIEFNDLIVWEAVSRIAAVSHGDTQTFVNAQRLAGQRLEALLKKFGMNRAVRLSRAVIGGGYGGDIVDADTPVSAPASGWTIDYQGD